MMFSEWACLIGFALICVCNSAFVDTLGKCSSKDGDCLSGLIENIIKDISKIGVQELNIPAIDPLALKNISIPIMGLLSISLDDAQMNGIKECVVNSIRNDLEKGVSNMDMTCDLSIKAKFKLDDLSPFVQNLFGSKNAVHADGNLKLKLDKFHLKLQFFYHLVKKDDGDIYIECHLDEFNHNYEIGNLKMAANNIFIGNQDISEVFVVFFNQNWKFITSIFGKSVFDVAMNVFENILHRFFVAVPVKYYLTDDISSFVKY